jgi:hypothetical protein
MLLTDNICRGDPITSAARPRAPSKAIGIGSEIKDAQLISDEVRLSPSLGKYGKTHPDPEMLVLTMHAIHSIK